MITASLLLNLTHATASVRSAGHVRPRAPVGPRLQRPGRPPEIKEGLRGMTDTSTGPFAGVRVLDLSTAATGPYAATLMADQGADVIKVERLGIGDIAR